jgi:hypothetical protein
MSNYELYKRGEPVLLREMSPIAEMVTSLKAWSIVPHPDLNLPFAELIPLHKMDLESGLANKWASAVRDKELCRGTYLPHHLH